MRIKAIFVFLAGFLMLIVSGCAANTSGISPVGVTSASAAVPAPVATTATTPPPSPVPPAPPPARSKAYDVYMAMVGGNVPGNREVKPTSGGQCAIHFGGRVTKLSSAGDNVLVSYDYPFTATDGSCNKGAQFLLPASAFKSFPAETKLADEVFVAELKAMNSMVPAQKPLEPTGQPSFGYVRVMNIEPLYNSDKVTFPFWSLCNLYDEATGKINGQFGRVGPTPWGTLVELTVVKPAHRGDCPDGTLMILEDQQLNAPIFLGYEKFLPLPKK